MKSPCKLNIVSVLRTTESRTRVWCSGMHLGSLVAWDAVRSKVVVILSLIHCLLLLPLFEVVLYLILVCYALLGVLSSVAIILTRKRELVALLYCYYYFMLCGFFHGTLG